MITTDLGISHVRAAFRQKLLTVSGIPTEERWAIENREFQRPPEETWLAERLVPQASVAASIGVTNRVARMNGTYFVDLFFASNVGSTESDLLIGKIRQAFEPGSHLNYDGQVVRIRTFSVGGARNDFAGWLLRPLTIAWQADNITL